MRGMVKMLSDIVIALARDPDKKVEVMSLRPQIREALMEVAEQQGISLTAGETWRDGDIYRFTIESFKYIKKEES